MPEEIIETDISEKSEPEVKEEKPKARRQTKKQEPEQKKGNKVVTL